MEKRSIIHGFDMKIIENRLKTKRRDDVKSKIFPNNYLFEEAVVILKKDNFLDQFLRDDMIKFVLAHPSVFNILVGIIKQEIEPYKKTIENLQKTNTFINIKLKEYMNKVDKLNETFNVCFDGLTKKIEDLEGDEVEIYKKEVIKSVDEK